ncbi:protein translocase subunit SecD [Actinomadura alba]|uniref:protein translocase subunit SecD n=1 Tax=Actinomadura alba TaxID=406431 RepID=UPI0031D9667E
MASPRSNTPKPGRAIIALLITMVALTGVMFWQGTLAPKLALDLAGGTTVTLTAVTESGRTAPPAQMTQALEIMRDRVNGLGVSEAEVTKQGANVIVIQVPGREGQQRIVKLIGTTAQLQFRQVFAVQAAGTQPTAPPATPTPTPTSAPTGKSPSPSGSPGVSPSSTPRGRALSDALVAPTPNPSPTPSKPADSKSPSPATSPPAQQPVPPPTSDLSGIDDPAVVQQFQQLTCAGPNKQAPGADDPRKKWVAACDQDGTAKYILGPVRVEGRQVSSADPVPPDPTQGRASWSVSLNFRAQGAKEFGAVTTDASNAQAGTPQRQVAIVLDGTVVSAPSIDRGAILGGQASIDGPPESFTQQYATDLASVLKYGALPLKFEQSSIETVSPTLGKDQLNAGLLAGAIGLGLVVLYSMLYYRGLGLVSVLSLLVAGVLAYQSVALLGKFIDFRLSLAGIAGLIVAIGITADSFVVYFERLRDEVREGRSLRSAVERGWERARRTILVADAVSFLAAAVLYLVSIGGVKGFAFTLGLTTLIDVVVVFLFTKPMISWLARFGFFGKGHPMSGLDPRRLGGKTKVTARPVTKEA